MFKLLAVVCSVNPVEVNSTYVPVDSASDLLSDNWSEYTPVFLLLSKTYQSLYASVLVILLIIKKPTAKPVAIACPEIPLPVYLSNLERPEILVHA